MKELEQAQTNIYKELIALTIESEITWKSSHSAW